MFASSTVVVFLPLLYRVLIKETHILTKKGMNFWFSFCDKLLLVFLSCILDTISCYNEAEQIIVIIFIGRVSSSHYFLKASFFPVSCPRKWTWKFFRLMRKFSKKISFFANFPLKIPLFRSFWLKTRRFCMEKCQQIAISFEKKWHVWPKIRQNIGRRKKKTWTWQL